VAAVNAVILRLNLPWRALRDAVQHATPAGVGLLALAPDANRRSVRITAEAKDSEAMLGYVDALERGGWFRAVRLARHEIDEARPERPLRFEVDAVWSGDTP
jgi:Tfp pilus assembly protein PilN